MGWPISQLTEYPEPKWLVWWRWGLLLLVFIAIGFGISLCFGSWREEDERLFWLSGFLLPAFIWLIALGIRTSHYLAEAKIREAWERAERENIAEWQIWSRMQLPVLAQALLTPEEKGIELLIGDPKNIPAFPKKSRPLYISSLNSDQPAYAFLTHIHKQLEDSYPNYRRNLATIYISAHLFTDKALTEVIYHQWDLYPQPIESYADLISELFASPPDLPVMILSSQYWKNADKQPYSEMVSAQIVSSKRFIQQMNIEPVIWMGRLMPSSAATLNDDLQQLFSFNRLSAKDSSGIWLSGMDKQNSAVLATFAYQTQLSLNPEHPFHLLDLSFAEAGPEMGGLLSTVAGSAARMTGMHQLYLCQSDKSSEGLLLQLMSAEKFN
ncbi:hypothetical protein ELQ32_13860 [Limnobaculum zhutongyuii]|nr:hypothetical protein [Limnobaculum zhutongyuii]TQS87403.1 hypothetical protein ELQ32_13860 [Limnobaculum zhutongyuii]